MKQITFPEGVHWIASKRKDGFPIETSYFKTIFSLDLIPGEVVIQISANTRYILYVNGEELIHGPCRGDHWHHFCDSIDIAPYLKNGENIIAAKVTAYPPTEIATETRDNVGPLWAMTRAIGPMLIVNGNAGEHDLSTGRAKWYYKNDYAIKWEYNLFALWMGCTEEVHGKHLDHNWQNDPNLNNGYNEAYLKWDTIIRFGEINPLILHERPIDYLIRKEIKGLSVITGYDISPDSETTFTANGTYEVILLYKSLTTAFIYLSCKGGAGSKVNILYSEAFSKYDGERYYKDNRLDTEGELRGVSDIYYPGGGNETYSPSWFRTFRFIKLTIETGNEPLTLYPLKMLETRYPLENKVQFTAKQAWLQDVWEISLRTLELCMHETYEDCPFYEQLQYTMDTRLQMLFTHIISNDKSMQRRAIHDYHSSITPEGLLTSRFPSQYTQIIPAFSLHWIFMLKDDFMETGDITLLERYRPTMENILAYFKRKTGPQGLVEYLGYWDFAEWADAWEDIGGQPRASLYGPSTIQNLVYANTLETAAWIMDNLSYGCLAEKYRIEKQGILDNIEKLCWSGEKGLYREGPGYEEYSQHAQLWAVLAGLTSDERAKEIMNKALSDKTLVPCSFVLQFYLFRALEKAGLYDETEKLWPMWKELIDLGCTTVPEIPGKFVRSECHAWGSLILHELPRKFLGVSPLTPGYEKIQIKPMGLFIDEISGQTPTPHGNVCVKRRLTEGKEFILEGSTPVPAHVILPDGSEHNIDAGEFMFNIKL